MPELHRLQTCIPLSGADFAPVLARFANVLRELGVWNADVQAAFARFHLTPSPAGMFPGGIYSTVSELAHYHSPQFPVAIRPHVTVWNEAVLPELPGIELELTLLLETTALTVAEHDQYHYRPGIQTAVQRLARRLHAAFPHTGIYFTDEAQDGRDISALRDDEPDELWQFDYALLPTAVAARYPPAPATHHTGADPGYVEAWYTGRWR